MTTPFDPGRLGGYRDQAIKRLNQIAQTVLEGDARDWFVMAAGDAWLRSSKTVGESIERWGQGMDDDEWREFLGQMGQAFFGWVLFVVMTEAIENPRDEELRRLVWEMLEERGGLDGMDGPPMSPPDSRT